jgi:Ser/Thr protein kinase RdoA (MazF antagonist)
MTPPDPRPPSEDHVRQGLVAFGVSGARTVLLRHGDNAVYRVDLVGSPPLALRLHTAARHTRRAIDAELRWLEHLGSHLPGTVPRPLRSEAGELTVSVAMAGDAAPLLCSLLSWVEGTPLEEGTEFSSDEAAQAGGLLAQIHILAEQFRPGPDFDRPTYDPSYFRRCALELRSDLTPDVWSPERSDTLLTNLEALTRQLGSWETLPGGSGLVHADAHPGNFVRQDGGLGLLDWDRCGFGPFLLDLAGVPLALDEPEREVFMTSYTRVRPLPRGATLPLRVLRLLATVENLGVLARRPHERPFVLDVLPVLERSAAALRADTISGRERPED